MKTMHMRRYVVLMIVFAMAAWSAVASPLGATNLRRFMVERTVDYLRTYDTEEGRFRRERLAEIQANLERQFAEDRILLLPNQLDSLVREYHEMLMRIETDETYLSQSHIPRLMPIFGAQAMVRYFEIAFPRAYQGRGISNFYAHTLIVMTRSFFRNYTSGSGWRSSAETTRLRELFARHYRTATLDSPEGSPSSNIVGPSEVLEFSARLGDTEAFNVAAGLVRAYVQGPPRGDFHVENALRAMQRFSGRTDSQTQEFRQLYEAVRDCAHTSPYLRQLVTPADSED